MSVPSGKLTDTYRTELLEFYGGVFGWRELESLRRPDRLTIGINESAYLNLRERPAPMVCSGYEHFGFVVPSADTAREIWDRLDADPRDVNLEPLTAHDSGFSSFRFRYLLPLAVEVQSFAS